MAQVAARLDEFEKVEMQIINISFVGEPFASAWLQETQFPFPFLLDKEQAVYQAYGLARSVRRSWGPRNLWYYARALVSGRKTYGKRGDPNQLGGDFIVNATGTVCLAHPSREPTDRPSIEKLLAF